MRGFMLASDKRSDHGSLNVFGVKPDELGKVFVVFDQLPQLLVTKQLVVYFIVVFQKHPQYSQVALILLLPLMQLLAN